MTWSIIARDPRTGQIGVAVASCVFAVGARVPFVATGVGVVATQAFINPFYGIRGLGLLRAGTPAAEVVRVLTEGDAGSGLRQVHVMDAQGLFAAHTGSGCEPWCGHLIGDDFSVAGNSLSSSVVIKEVARVFAEQASLPFPRRLLATLKAGEDAGGDRRGRQSAALLVHDGEDYPLLDIRVDDHADPLAELARLEEVSRRRYIHVRTAMPCRANPAGITDPAEIERRIAQSIADAMDRGTER